RVVLTIEAEILNTGRGDDTGRRRWCRSVEILRDREARDADGQIDSLRERTETTRVGRGERESRHARTSEIARGGEQQRYTTRRRQWREVGIGLCVRTADGNTGGRRCQ